MASSIILCENIITDYDTMIFRLALLMKRRFFLSALSSRDRVSVAQAGSLFSKLNQIYKDYIEAETFYVNVS